MKISIIPFKKTIFKTNLSDSEVIESLSNEIGVFKSFSFKNSERNADKQFYGKIKNNNFEIYQIIKGRNSFIPLIKGFVNTENDKTIIVIKMRFHSLVIILITFFIGFLSIGSIMDYNKSGDSQNLFIGLLMALLLYVFAVVEFNKQTEKVTKILKKIFEAEII